MKSDTGVNTQDIVANSEIRQINFSERNLVTGLFDSYRVFYKQSSDLGLAEDFILYKINVN